MRTIEEIKAKCEIFPHDHALSKREHWVWQGAVSKNGKVPSVLAPDFTKDRSGNTTSVQSVARAIRHITTSKPIRKGWGGYRCCDVEGCVSPDCTMWGTRAEFGEYLRESGRHCGSILRRLGAQRRWEGKRKVDPALVPGLMADPRPQHEVARELGVHKSTVGYYRRGLAAGPAAGMFSGLMR